MPALMRQMGEGSLGMEQAMMRKTAFRLTSDAEQVYLRLTPDQGSSAMIPMRRRGGNDWGVEVPLSPGVYRFRYYCVEHGGGLVMCHPGGDPAAGKLDGKDGVLRVADDPAVELPGCVGADWKGALSADAPRRHAR